MNVMDKRKRSPAWTKEEKSILICEVAKRIKILDSQHCNDVTQKAKIKAYDDISSAVNSIGHFKRSVKSVKEKWQSEKSRVKAMQGEYEKRKRKCINATGGGPLEEIRAPNFDETDLNILKLIPPESYKGIESDSEDSDEEVDDATSSIGKLNEILNRSFSVKSFDQSFDFFFFRVDQGKHECRILQTELEKGNTYTYLY